jgi:hypothetical protein
MQYINFFYRLSRCTPPLILTTFWLRIHLCPCSIHPPTVNCFPIGRKICVEKHTGTSCLLTKLLMQLSYISIGSHPELILRFCTRWKWSRMLAMLRIPVTDVATKFSAAREQLVNPFAKVPFQTLQWIEVLPVCYDLILFNPFVIFRRSFYPNSEEVSESWNQVLKTWGGGFRFPVLQQD